MGLISLDQQCAWNDEKTLSVLYEVFLNLSIVLVCIMVMSIFIYVCYAMTFNKEKEEITDEVDTKRLET